MDYCGYEKTLNYDLLARIAGANFVRIIKYLRVYTYLDVHRYYEDKGLLPSIGSIFIFGREPCDYGFYYGKEPELSLNPLRTLDFGYINIKAGTLESLIDPISLLPYDLDAISRLYYYYDTGLSL